MADLLSQLEQKEKQKEASAPNLDEIAAALVQQSILKHKNNEVRLLAACCLADIFRIYAPNPPYDDTQLEVPNDQQRFISFYCVSLFTV